MCLWRISNKPTEKNASCYLVTVVRSQNEDASGVIWFEHLLYFECCKYDF